MSQDRLPERMSDNQTPPFLRTMQREMTQLLDRFRGQNLAAPGEFFEALNTQVFPALDVAETDDSVEITAEVPGVKEDDLDISITRDVLVLKGKKETEREESEKDYQLVERRYGSFRRQVPLGFTPAEGAVEARFADGVLKLKIAKPPEARSSVQRIKISKP